MRVLIAYDGSQCAESALDDLIHAGLPQKGEALVLTVAEVWLPPPPPSAFDVVEMVTARSPQALEHKYMSASKSVETARDQAARAAVRLSAKFPDWKVAHEAVWGSPSWELYSRAEAWKADLIVVGSHGRSAVSKFFLGSISQWLLTEARCSVRVGRGKLDEPDFPVRLLLGLDGSNNAKKALEEIAARRWPEKSEVRVVTVHHPVEVTAVGNMVVPLSTSIDEINQKEGGKAQRLVEAAARKLRDAGLRVSAQVLEGDPKQVLVGVAEDWRADCIFLGATGVTNRFERFLLGSTAGAVSARAHCSVEIIRRRRKRRSNGNGN